MQQVQHFGPFSYHALSFAADFQNDPSSLDLALYCPPLGFRPHVFPRTPYATLSPALSSYGVPNFLHLLHPPAMARSQKIRVFPTSFPSDVATNRGPKRVNYHNKLVWTAHISFEHDPPSFNLFITPPYIDQKDKYEQGIF